MGRTWMLALTGGGLPGEGSAVVQAQRALGSVRPQKSRPLEGVIWAGDTGGKLSDQSIRH